MELREYAGVIRRHLWLILLLVFVVGAGSWVLRARPAPQYQATARLTIGVNALPADKVTGYDPTLTAYQASEYIRDDFVQVVSSDVFADDVNAELAKMGISGVAINKGNISGGVDKQHRLMTLTITWNDAAQAQKIADAAVTNLAQNNSKYFAELGSSAASVAIIDHPSVSLVAPSLRERLDIPIRVALALFAGVALAFLLEYLDTSVRDGQDAQALGLAVLGEIPAPRRRWWPRTERHPSAVPTNAAAQR